VIEKSKLPKEEFKLDVDQNIPSTSIYYPPLIEDVKLPLLNKTVEKVSKQFLNNKNQLEQLEITLNDHHLVNELYISGRPILGKGSWISSPFGTRSDPFTGRLRRHRGVDIAGYTGMPSYAHAKSLIVPVGAVVEKGQKIAVMGSTGRSTGPHVHYEVIKNGRRIDPNYYIHRLPS